MSDHEHLPAVEACADLVHRSGAKSFEIGFDEGPPVTFYAVATYTARNRATGAGKLMTDGHAHPEQAADALSTRILGHGGRCAHCGNLVIVETDAGGLIPLAVAQGRETGCSWARRGQANRWKRGCE